MHAPVDKLLLGIVNIALLYNKASVTCNLIFTMYRRTQQHVTCFPLYL